MQTSEARKNQSLSAAREEVAHADPMAFFKRTGRF